MSRIPLLRTNSGQNLPGLGDISPKILANSGSGYITGGNDVAGFYSSDDNIINDSSQISEGKSKLFIKIRLLGSRTGTGKSLFFRNQSSRGLARAPGNGIGTGNNLGQLMNKSKFYQDASSYGGHERHRVNNHLNMVDDELIKSSSGGSEVESDNEYGSFRGGERRKKHGQGSSSSQYASI